MNCYTYNKKEYYFTTYSKNKDNNLNKTLVRNLNNYLIKE